MNGYLQWYTHNFLDARTNCSLVEHYWGTHRKRLPPRAQQILDAWHESYAAVCEVMRVEKGIGVEMRNVASDEILFVTDVTFSREAVVGEWTLSRFEFLDGRWQLVSDGFRVQPGLEPRLLEYIKVEARAARETADQFIRRNGNRLYRVLVRLGRPTVQ